MGQSNSDSFNAEEFIIFMYQDRIRDIIRQEHMAIISELKQGTFEASSNPKNRSRNRYTSLMCFDHTRVKIAGDITSEDYIHANFIDGYATPKKFICTQAPLDYTCYDFWCMMSTCKIRFVITFLKAEGNGLDNNCFQYWSHEIGSAVYFGQFMIKTLQILFYKHNIVTDLEVSDVICKRTWQVTHIAYKRQVDSSKPENVKNFIDFIFETRLLSYGSNLNINFANDYVAPPIVVHCNNGIGISAVFCALDIAITTFNNTKRICLSSIVKKLRKQRYNSFQSFDHYYFLYLCMFEYIKLWKKTGGS